VSRDRSSEYAAAIRKGAPQALEVADRWHLTKNLVESVQTLLARCRAEIRRALPISARPEQETKETEPILEEENRPVRSCREEEARLARRAQKLDRYQQVLELHDQGLTAAEIGSRIGMSGRTVQRWLAHGSLTASQAAAQTTQLDRSV
jgi:transposase